MRCFLQIVELSHKQVQKTEQMGKNRNQAIRHDQETKIPTIETISKIQNTIPISETIKTQIDNTVAVGKQAANLPAKHNEMKLDNPTTATIISGFNEYPEVQGLSLLKPAQIGINQKRTLLFRSIGVTATIKMSHHSKLQSTI